jgi:hypothetical protein
MITSNRMLQAPGGTQEDTSGDFAYGGWVAKYSDEACAKAVQVES